MHYWMEETNIGEVMMGGDVREDIGFTCIICQYTYKDSWNLRYRGRTRYLPPLCLSCETQYGGTEAAAGAFKDRRLCRQVGALASALHTEANIIEWNRSGRVARL